MPGKAKRASERKSGFALGLTRTCRSADAPLRIFHVQRMLALMERFQTYREWWRPLPAWLKLITAVCIYPAAFFIFYCVLTGTSKSGEAFIAFGVCMVGALTHIVCDRRNRLGAREPGGVDFFGGE
jgi:hypothetical protein